MSRLTIQSEGPEPITPRWQWGGPKPDGYGWPAGTLTPGLFLRCETCGAMVDPDAADQHTGWHARLFTRTGQA